mmetsp:Transcript_15684/g.33995  ORF Transcript_15684/g.33995 Transcript_15684/m.33995 type:complete len:206 (-) Transcript_15684:71-688(-)
MQCGGRIKCPYSDHAHDPFVRLHTSHRYRDARAHGQAQGQVCFPVTTNRTTAEFRVLLNLAHVARTSQNLCQNKPIQAYIRFVLLPFFPFTSLLLLSSFVSSAVSSLSRFAMYSPAYLSAKCAIVPNIRPIIAPGTAPETGSSSPTVANPMAPKIPPKTKPTTGFVPSGTFCSKRANKPRATKRNTAVVFDKSASGLLYSSISSV